MKFFLDVIQYLHNLMQQSHILKTFIIFLFRIYCCFFLFFILSGESIYDPPRLKFILWHLQSSNWTEPKVNILPLIVLSKLFWYLERSESKSSSTTSFASLQDINFILLLIECIIRSFSESIEKIKLITIVNWIFYVSDFWRSIIISVK